MIPEAREVRLRPKVREVLEARCRAPSTPQGEVKRARIVLLAGEGFSTRSIAKEVGVQPRIVSKWRHRFADHGLAGLNDRPRAAKPPIYGPATNKRILALLDKQPPRAMPDGRVRCWRRRWKTLMFNMFGGSCGSTRSIWLRASPGARATILSLWPKQPMWTASTLTRQPRRLSSVSTKSLRSRRWSGRKDI